MSSHVFDESKERDYLLVASIHVSGDLDDLRKLMRGLVLRGQRRVHMKESDPRRHAAMNSTLAPLAGVASSRTPQAG